LESFILKLLCNSQCKMLSCASMSKQSDTQSHNHLRRDSGLRKLCVMGGLKYVFDGSGAYTDWTDWKEQD